MSAKLPPIHPGEVLREEFMAPMGISINALARDLHIPVSRASKLVNEQRAITAGSAMRLGFYFGTTPEFWLNLQSRYELFLAKAKESAICREVRPGAIA